MDKRKTSHDLLNLIERLRIMHDLIKDQNFQSVSKEELVSDLESTLKEVKEKFEEMLQ